MSSTIAMALTSISHVTMFSGGRPVEGYLAPSGVDFVQLPAIRKDRADAASTAVDPGYTMAEIERMRSKLLVENYRRIKPRIVIIEHFPFSAGRWGETLNKPFDAINKEQGAPIVICSIRTYPRWGATDTDYGWINEHLRANLSCVLHHADSNVFPLTSLDLTYSPHSQVFLSANRVHPASINPDGP